jgi:pyruvate dehydrogenase E1 component alpha subunit
VFVCENNGFAVSARPATSQGVDSLADRARGMGLRTWSVDGYDAMAVHATAVEAIEHARSGHGPTFVETMTERRRGHFAGDLEPYRPKVPGVVHADPITALRDRLVQAGVQSDILASIESDAAAEMTDALEQALAAPKPGPGRILEGVWA